MSSNALKTFSAAVAAVAFRVLAAAVGEVADEFSPLRQGFFLPPLAIDSSFRFSGIDVVVGVEDDDMEEVEEEDNDDVAFEPASIPSASIGMSSLIVKSGGTANATATDEDGGEEDGGEDEEEEGAFSVADEDKGEAVVEAEAGEAVAQASTTSLLFSFGRRRVERLVVVVVDAAVKEGAASAAEGEASSRRELRCIIASLSFSRFYFQRRFTRCR